MGRTLRVRLIAEKKKLYAERLRINDEKADVENALLSCEPSEAPNLYKRKHKAIDDYLCIQRQLNRAQLYGRLYAGDVILRCIPCFVLHDILRAPVKTGEML